MPTSCRFVLVAALCLTLAGPSAADVDRDATFRALSTRPNDVYWRAQWGLHRTGFARAWDVARGTRRTIVAVVDTGIDSSHPDLRGALLPGYDFVDDDADPSDRHGHGTAVAGILAARGNNRTGIAGVCWRCRILPVRVLARNGTGNSDAIAAGIVWAVDHGATVINLSLGAQRPSSVVEDAVEYAADRDVVVVAAAGNHGSTRRFYPAAYAPVVAVAASDRGDRIYSWSNRGRWVDVAAPGCNTAPWRGKRYTTLCGTSAAAPLVAGLAALIRSADPSASAAETRRILGRGRLDASGALPRPRTLVDAVRSVLPAR